MSLEKSEEPPVEAALKGGSAHLDDPAVFGSLEQAGYGEREGKRLVLKDYETLYLLFSGRLKLKDKDGADVSFNSLAERAQDAARDSWTKFIIYRDLRSRGYIVKDGFGFGTDLRVYERGDFPQKAAKFVVFALDEGTEKEVGELNESVRQIIKMGKEAIVAVIERRGEVIYYKVSRANFRK
ncbi:MAG: tRNA-intron lyase [Thaumarchaeota archaeon]|nr:tRNA-intron lyase [Nitrososphaerota archaeon]